MSHRAGARVWLLLAVVLPLTAAAREMKVGFYRYDRFHEQTVDGVRSGLGYEMLELLAKEAGWTNRYIGYDRVWDDMAGMVASGEIDILDCVHRLPEREELYDFSTVPAGYSCGYVLVRNNDRRYAYGEYTSWRRISVGAVAGERLVGEFRKFAEEHEIGLDLRTFRDENEVSAALRSSEIDAAVIDSMAYDGEFRIVGEFNPRPYFFCVKKGNRALVDEIDRALASAKAKNPDMYVEMRRKYQHGNDVTVYLPRNLRHDEVQVRYLKAMACHLAAVGDWYPVFRECAEDFSDADFTKPSIAAYVRRTPGNLVKFDFPFVAVCRRMVCLSGRPDDVRFADGIPADVNCLAIAYLRNEREWLGCFLDYARHRGFAYELLPCDSMEELRRMTLSGGADLAVVGADPKSELRFVQNCGWFEFDFATPKAMPALRYTLDLSLRYVRYHEHDVIQRLEKNAYGYENSGRTVRVGAYIEPGLVELGGDGTVSGFIVDYLREVARQKNWDLIFVPMTYPDAQTCLASGDVDVVGAAVKTPERERLWDYSRRDIGPLHYVLKVRTDSKFLPNRPEGWTGACVGYLAGSKAVEDLAAYFGSIGASCRLVPYSHLEEAEAAVRRGDLDGCYTLLSRSSVDLRTLFVKPTQLTYFCTNRRRPQLKADLDAVMDQLSRFNVDFESRLKNFYFPGSRESMTLDQREISYVDRHRGRKIRVGMPVSALPVIGFDENRRAGGFITAVFRRIAAESGLELEFTAGDRADVFVMPQWALEGRKEPVVERDWCPIPSVRVSLPEGRTPERARGVLAVEEKRTYEVDFIRRSGYRTLAVGSRIEAYRAVAEGRAEALVDNMGAARLMIDESREFRDLVYVRLETSLYARQIALAFPNGSEPELRSILLKARDSISSSDAEKMFTDALFESRERWFNREDIVTYAGRTAVVVLFLFGLIVVYTVFRVKFERHQRESAAAANRAKTAFLFNMSHDIRTPMNAINGFTDIAKKNLGDRARVKDCLDKIENSGRLLLSLIDSVLDMSRVESGNARLEELPADVMASFASIETTMRELAKVKGITLTFEYGEIPDRHVYADRERCIRVFVNIISNAIKYSKPNGWVRVRCEEIEAGGMLKAEGGTMAGKNRCPASDLQPRISRYRYTFEDNGIGMSEEFLTHVFEEFARERNSTTSGIQGTGLGMPLCKSFVELMGGTISCRSKQGEGTVFTVELPFRVREMSSDESSSAGESSRASSHPHSKSCNNSFTGRRLLLVEDNELNREVAEFALREHGFTVETAADGSVAVRMVKEKGTGYYDYVLMDIQMPIMGGYEATKAIRKWEQETKSDAQTEQRKGKVPNIHCSPSPRDFAFHLPIIALSANAFAEDKAASIAAGMDDHVAKPLRISELLEVLSKF